MSVSDQNFPKCLLKYAQGTLTKPELSHLNIIINSLLNLIATPSEKQYTRKKPECFHIIVG